MTGPPDDTTVSGSGAHLCEAPSPTSSPGHDGRKKLLLVSYHFPPSSAIGALRWAGLTRYLADLGWEIRVISAFPPDGQSVLDDRITICPVARRHTLNDRYVDYKVRRDGARSSGAAARSRSTGVNVPQRSEAGGTGRPVGGLRGLVRRLGTLLSWPDEGRGWMTGTAREIRRWVGEYSPDLIVSSGPPHSVHLAVLMSGAYRSTPWVLDWRDPWYVPLGDPMTEATGAGPIVNWSYRKMEGAVVSRASSILVTTPELRNVLARRYSSVNAHWIPNGVDLELIPQPLSEPYPGLAVVHLGTVYLLRDPKPLIEGFKLFLRRNPEQRKAGSCLRFVGDVEPKYRRGLEDQGSDPLAGRVEFTGWKPRSEALEILQRSAVSVVLAQQQMSMVPAKIYESVALGIPTLVITEPGSATDRAAERFGLFRVAPDDPEGVARVLETVASGGRALGRESAIPVTYREIAIHVDRLLRSIARAGRGSDRMAQPLHPSPFDGIDVEAGTTSLSRTTRDQP